MKTTAKRFAGWLLVLAMLLTLLPQAVIAEDPGGAADLTITTLEDLEAFRAEVDSGNTFEGQLVELTADIDLSAVCGETIGSWNLIGDSTNSFLGTFDGGGYEISGLYINDSSGTYQGLFGYLGSGGTIRDLAVSGSVTGGTFVGGIAGGSVGSILDCENKCDISGSSFVGGVVGIVTGTGTAVAVINGCSNSGSVESTSPYSGSIAGGIAGSVSSEYVNIEECVNHGDVGSTSMFPVSNVGGIAGMNYGTIEKSVNGQGAEIYGSVCALGGIAGYNFRNISNCYNLGTFTATGIPAEATIGGIAGSSYQVGYPGDTSAPSSIENCYSYTGSITAGAQENSVSNSYYLSDAETAKTNGMTGKTAAQFASGEVARLLQDGQTADGDGVKSQVWGQTLSGATPDAYPVLTADSAKAIMKVSFMTASGQEGAYAEYTAAYANPGGTVTLPQTPTSDEYEFVRWSQTQSTDGTEFTAQTAVNGDMTVYAVGEEMYGETDAEKKIETTYGTAATKDLSDYMTYAAGTDASEKFTYVITGGNSTTATANGNTVNASISGDTLSIPAGTNADTYTLTIQATAKEPELSMFAADYDTEPVTFDVTVVVAKISADITTAPTANTLTYNGTAQALVTAGTAVGGTLMYSLAEDGEYSANIPTGTEADTYTVWYKVSADSNHIDTEPQSRTVTIGRAGSESEVSGSETVVYGETLTLTAEVSRAQADEVSLMAEQDEVEFFVGETSLGTADVVYDTMLSDEGTATLNINTADKQLAIGDNTIKAVYGGSVNLNGSESGTITVNMQPKPIEYTVTAEDKVYDGTNTVNVTLTPANVTEGDDITLTAEGTVESADYGEYSTVDLSNIAISGEDAAYYRAASSAEDVALTEPVSITTNTETVSVTIDYNNMTLNGFEAGRTYVINGEETTVSETSIAIEDDWFGTDVTVMKKAADGNHTDSEVQTVSIPARPDAPEGVRGGNSSGSDSNGSIRGVDETMEYRVSPDGEWTAVTGTTLTGLEIGTYEVRISATDNSFPSEAVSIRIVRTYSGNGGSGGGGGGTTPTETPTAAPAPEATDGPEQTGEPTETPEITEQPAGTDVPSGGDEQSGFTDVPEDAWYKDTVDYVVENGLMNGTSETEFSPETDITRGMFVTVLYRMEGSPETELDYSFTDVAADAYYAEAVAWADDNGIVTGYSAEEFVPDQTISREQMAAIIYRYAGHKGADMDVSGNVNYVDAESVSGYALTAVEWVSENGIMQGRTDGTFAPAEFTTRAEAAAVFERTHKMFG